MIQVKKLSCFRLWLAYDGSNFSGFQEQENARTVQGELKKAFFAITNENINITAAGRTDAGVHAKAQAVSVEFATKLNNKQLTLALASKLPDDVSVWRVDSMPLGFNARHQSTGKQYVYRIYQGLVADPFMKKQTLFIRRELDILAMNAAAKYFIGEHDFSSFRQSSCSAKHAIRYIWHVAVEKKGSLIEIDIRGNAFCLNMVRIIAGTLIEVGQHRRKADSIEKALMVGDRRLAGVTAKAHGLSFEKVYYPDDLKQAAIPIDAKFPRYPVRKQDWGYEPHEIIYGPS